MNNYWLSEYSNPQSPEDSSDEDTMDDSSDNPEPKDKLIPRQQSLYDYYESVVEEFGMFDQTSKANGAHYAPAKVNPFIKEGLICGNCVFYLGGNGCEIVKGTIEPNAICKLWIIPEDLITIKK
jgi:hypothetical protein